MHEIEDWSINRGSHKPIHGGPVISAPTISLREPCEVLAWEMLYQTLIDCYKVAIGAWQHFRPMEWHHKADAERTLDTARRKVRDWVESDAFWAYLKLCGWNPDIGQCRALEVLDGKHNEKFEEMLQQISRERDARRTRS